MKNKKFYLLGLLGLLAMVLVCISPFVYLAWEYELLPGNDETYYIDTHPELFPDSGDLPNGWFITYPGVPPQSTNLAPDGVMHVQIAKNSMNSRESARLDIRKTSSLRGARRYFNGAMNYFSKDYAQLPFGFTGYPKTVDEYRLGCDVKTDIAFCKYHALKGRFTIDLEISLNPITASEDLTRIISALDRRIHE